MCWSHIYRSGLRWALNKGGSSPGSRSSGSVQCKRATSSFWKSPEVSERTMSRRDFWYFSWNFAFIPWRSAWRRHDNSMRTRTFIACSLWRQAGTVLNRLSSFAHLCHKTTLRNKDYSYFCFMNGEWKAESISLKVEYMYLFIYM